jgi:hypothetical protein
MPGQKTFLPPPSPSPAASISTKKKYPQLFIVLEESSDYSLTIHTMKILKRGTV